MELSPEDLDLSTRYRIMAGAIVPRPIAMVSTISADGQPNLAPYSFFNGAGSNPMTLLFCPANN
ncbi:MAG: flavin reductase family protein, partial [Thermoanaerobaculia bacterium]